MIDTAWENWLLQRSQWLPTITFIPIVYLFGWLSVQFALIIFPVFKQQNLSLIVTLISFLVFISLLPSWVKLRWKNNHPFLALGLAGSVKVQSLKYFFRGLIYSIGLLIFVLLPLLIASWGKWTNTINSEILTNAFFLTLVVGLAEEILFRGWLLVEMSQLVGPKRGLIIHAVIFSLVHIRFDISFWALFGLLIGLFLLGIVLALMRKLDKGSLWGCVGLHGGLVGGWFLISGGLVEFSLDIPSLLYGPSGSTLNPLGGLVGILILILTLWCQCTALAIAGNPCKGALNASSRGA